jgi:predicted permease
MGMWRRFRNLWRGSAVDREIEEELESHLNMRADEYQGAGLSAADARSRARRQFGNAMRMKEEVREADLLGWLDTTRRDLLYGLRMLRRSPAFTAIAIGTLALGIGANTAIFSVVNAVLLEPLPLKEPDRLVWAWGQVPGGDRAAIAPADVLDYRAQNQTFEQIAAIGLGTQLFNLATGDKPELVKGGMVTAGFFETLGVPPAYGRLFIPADEQVSEPEAIVLGQRLWKERFAGDKEIVGKKVKIDGKGRTVVGVLAMDLSVFSKLDTGIPSQAELWIATPYRNEGMHSRRSHFLRLIGAKKKGVTLEEAQADLDAINDGITRRYPNEVTEGFHLKLVPLKAALVGDTREALLILLAAVSLVLLIACTNVANILLARNTARAREMAVRTALGASPLQIARQVLTESLLLSSLGALAGIALAVYAIRVLRVLAGYLPRAEEITVSAPVLMFTAAIALATGILFGAAPAVALSRQHPTCNLKDGGPTGSSRAKHRTQRLLVIAEVGLSLVVLIAAGLVLNSFWRVVHVNPGFDPSQVTTAQLSLVYEKYRQEPSRIELMEQLTRRIEALAGVEAAGFISELPLSGQLEDTFFRIREHPLANPKDTHDADVRVIAGNYFRAMHIPLLTGRSFTREDTPGSARVMLVNEAFAQQFFPGEGAIGRHLEIYEGQPEFITREIVGVVADNKHLALQERPLPQMFLPYAQSPFLNMNAVVRSAAPAPLAPLLREVLRATDPDEAWGAFRQMNEVVSASTSEERVNTILLAIFGLLALCLAAVGIFGVLSYLVTQKTREIGVRVALGARPRQVLHMVVSEGLQLTAAGLAIGLVVSLGVTRWIGSLLYEVKTWDPATYAVLTVALLLVAALACWLPARRATQVDPLVALRHE